MATYRKQVYCEFEFLKKYRDSSSAFNILTDENAVQMWLNVGKFIRKSQIMIDIKDEQFAQQLQTLPEKLNIAKKYVQGECVCSDTHGFEYVENVNKSTNRTRITYLIDKSAGICRNYALKFGIVTLSPSYWSSEKEAEANSYLFRDCGRAVEEGKYLKWADILRNQHNLSNCNSMVIIDNYILKSLNNLEEILNALLPRQIPGVTREDKFYLTIITAKDKSNTRNDENIYSQLVEKIKRIRPNLDFELDLFVEQNTSSNTFHDRYILTNNVIIKSGGGFDLIKNGKATKQTEVSILHPGIQSINDACDDEYMGVINRVTSKVVGCTNKGQWRHYPDNEPCSNRLIVRKE
jgi:hypothetical protein